MSKKKARKLLFPFRLLKHRENSEHSDKNKFVNKLPIQSNWLQLSSILHVPPPITLTAIEAPRGFYFISFCGVVVKAGWQARQSVLKS